MTTRDELLAMAEQADAEVYISFRPPQYRFTPKTLERFHALAVAVAVAAAVAKEREECAKARSAVPILPGEMPDAMWEKIKGDKDAYTEALRIVIRQTLDEYEAAIRARSAK